MELASKKSCGQRIYYFLWLDREHVYNKSTTPAPYCSVNALFSIRLVFFTIVHALFWSGLASELGQFFSFFSTWQLMMQVITFSLLIIVHIFDFYEQKSLEGFVVPNANPYTPTIIGDNELFRLNSRTSKLWKYAIISYEIMAPITIQVTVIFWVFFYIRVDWTQYNMIETVRIYLDNILPLAILILDQIFNAILFSKRHFFFCILALAIFDTLYWLVYYMRNEEYKLQKAYDWDHLDLYIQILIQMSCTLICYFVMYVISQTKIKKYSKTANEKRRTIKQRHLRSTGKFNEGSFLTDQDFRGNLVAIS
ncbi:UNKNOWN [Stylonychia lemnae]|uniref:Uncharacterized protein n=1 Tax=Stylonychia lemnae TaxID=5949 RepID=A0A077ZPZ9_STYLE|nr:UNKNOWN [Stylonychia lemnae]|eukprot:CDW71978.1 UNKNOWN [Stylonychia lemnae]